MSDRGYNSFIFTLELFFHNLPPSNVYIPLSVYIFYFRQNPHILYNAHKNGGIQYGNRTWCILNLWRNAYSPLSFWKGIACAFKNDTNYSKTSNLTEQKDNLKDWLHTRGFFQNEFPIQGDYESKHKPVYDKTFLNEEIKDIADISDTFALSFRNSGVMHNGVIYTEETLPFYSGHQVTLGEILETTRVDERYFLTPQQIEKFNYLKGPKRIERTSKDGFSYIFSEGGMTFPDDLSLPGRTMLTSEASVNRSTHVVSDKVTGKLRFLTPVEAERLNGFPDNWTDTGMPEKFRYFTMGNALVVSLIEKMGKTLNIIFEME